MLNGFSQVLRKKAEVNISFIQPEKEKETFIPKSKEEKQRENLSSFYVILLHKELRHLMDKRKDKDGGKFK